MTILEALWGSWACTPGRTDVSCCRCEDEQEVLTAAWIDSLEQAKISPSVSAFGEPPPSTANPDVVPVPIAQRPASLDPPLHERAQPGGAPGANGAPKAQLGSGLKQLWVPPEFECARRLILAQQGQGAPIQGGDEAEHKRCLQVSLKAFTRSLLRGVSVSVLLDDSRTRLAEARLDTDLTHLVLHVPHQQHPVALKCIESICMPDEAWAPPGAADTVGQALLDERCATLIISGGQFLTFVFDSVRTREYFETCLKVIILAGDHASPQSKQGDGGERQCPPLLPGALGHKVQRVDSSGSPSPRPSETSGARTSNSGSNVLAASPSRAVMGSPKSNGSKEAKAVEKVSSLDGDGGSGGE